MSLFSSFFGRKPQLHEVVFESFGRSDIGKKRDSNEDAFWLDDEIGAYLVCDGLGGHAAGEVASATARDAIADYLRKHKAAILLCQDGDEPISRAVAICADSLAVANSAVRSESDRRNLPDSVRRMATTATLLVRIGPRRAVLAHIGDSRAYLIRGGVDHQVSIDHTLVDSLIRSGYMTKEQAAESSWRGNLDRALGLKPIAAIDTLVLDLVIGDSMVLCTDGVSGYLSDQERLATRLKATAELDCESLVTFANEAGGNDNISVIVVHVRKPDDDPRGKIKSALPLKLSSLGASWLGDELPLRSLQRLANIAEVKTVEGGEALVSEGESEPGWLLVLYGALTSSNEAGDVDYLEVGDSTGARALARDRQSDRTITADGDSAVLLISGDDFQGLCDEKVRLGNILLRRLAAHLV